MYWGRPTLVANNTVRLSDGAALQDVHADAALLVQRNNIIVPIVAPLQRIAACDCVLMCLDYHPARDGTHTTYQSRQTIPSLHKPLIVLVLNGSSSAGVKKVPTVGTDLYFFRYTDLQQLPTGR